jgi:urease accessory protein
MIAVGLWGAQLGNPAIWVLPITFPLIMALGGMLGVLGVPVPSVEIGIAVSGIVLGIMVAGAVRPPLWLAMLLVGAFAIFHGHAHGTELPNATDPLAYGVGFVTATGLLHLAGILLGILIARPLGERAVRAAGVLIALGGGWFLLSGLGLLG